MKGLYYGVYLFCITPLLSLLNICDCVAERFGDFDMECVYENQSNDTICVIMGTIADSTKTASLILAESFEIPPGGKYCDLSYRDVLKKWFLQVDIWKKETIRKYGKEYIRKHDIVDKRYILNFEEYERMNYTIVYE